jgi:hypothetical protein
MASDLTCPLCGNSEIEYMPYIPVCRHCYFPSKFWPQVRDLQRRAEIGARAVEVIVGFAEGFGRDADRYPARQALMNQKFLNLLWTISDDARAAGMVP